MRKLLAILIIVLLSGVGYTGTISECGTYLVDQFILGTTDSLNSATLDSVCIARGWVAARRLTEFRWLVSLADTSAVAVVDSINASPIAPFDRAILDYASKLEFDGSWPGSSVIPDELKLPPIDGYDNDYYYDQWYLGQELLNIVDGWDYVTGTSNTIVAILDTGIDLYHPAWMGRIGNDIEVISMLGDNGHDYLGHGTMIAGIVLAAHDYGGVHGIAPGVRAEIYKVYEPGLDDYQLLSMYTAALDEIANRATINLTGRYVVNLSMGWDGHISGGDAIVRELSLALARLAACNNVLVVAAAGNQSRSHFKTPNGVLG